MKAENLKENLKAMAAELGFPLFGVTSVDLPKHYFDAFSNWLAKGQHAGMDWLSSRRDIIEGPQSILPGAKSVICLAMPYNHPVEPLGKSVGYGRVSRYATGRDYHRLIESRIKKLVRYLRGFGGSHRAYVDHGPVIERAYAAQAGIGFIGRNCCLIHPEFGSYIFLSVIFTSMELPFDSPLDMDCGECERCLKACPVGALSDSFQLDARLCLSYHSIENRKAISPEISRKFGSRLLGCDSCQEVCPYNRDAPSTVEPDLLAMRVPSRMDLRDLLSLSEEVFTERFRGTSAMRPGLSGMRRNAAIVAMNKGDASLLPYLKDALDVEKKAVTRQALLKAIAAIEKRR